jgi:DNA helicase-2/ATP-dependent DNA helicase PcrA
MIEFKKELNQEQYEAVINGNGNCLVLAGAGSGKTRVITYRVAYLIEHGIDPNNILLVTFTNKAAHEMIARIKKLLGEDIKMNWAGTFHHIGNKMLRRFANVLGYKNNFTILDSEDSADLIKLCLKKDGDGRIKRKFPSPAVLHSIISYSRNAQIPLEEVLEIKYPSWTDLSETILKIASEYAQKKKDANSMDFDDLLENTYLLLEKSEEAREKYSKQFQHILVDEYQDTNRIQALILKSLSSHHKNLFVVGDDAQSIYSFRAADIKNILDFEKEYQNAKIFKLETNYRSTPNILNVANGIIENNIDQYKKVLRGIRSPFAKPEVHVLSDQKEEAEFVSNRILELLDEGVDLRNIAVLFRAAHHSQMLEMELVKKNIKYDYRGGIRFFERAHIKDVLAFLKIFANMQDEVSWNRILNKQEGIGPATSLDILEMIKQYNGVDTVAGNIPTRAQVGWNDFLAIYKGMRISDGSPSELLKSIIDSKYQNYLELKYPDYRERLQDIEQLAVFAEKQPDLQSFLTEASLQENYVNPASESNEHKIILSTVHQAKGLEWEAVFIISMSNGQFPNERATREFKGIEEERRLFYVAVTRAKTHLCISYPSISGFNFLTGGPSMFLEEIDKEYLDADMTGGTSIFSDFKNEPEEIVYISEEDERPARKTKISFLREIEDL